MNRNRVGAAMAALGTIVILAPAQVSAPAGATNFSYATGDTGCNSGPNMADNRSHTFRFEALSTSMQGPTTYIMNNAIDATGIIDALMDPTPDSNTDVWVTDTHYTTLCGRNWMQVGESSGLVGLYTCESLSGSKCQQAKVRYNNNFTDGTTLNNRRGLACHENGHSLGLEHRADAGCMDDPGYPKEGNYYSVHDNIHITANY